MPGGVSDHYPEAMIAYCQDVRSEASAGARDAANSRGSGGGRVKDVNAGDLSSGQGRIVNTGSGKDPSQGGSAHSSSPVGVNIMDAQIKVANAGCTRGRMAMPFHQDLKRYRNAMTQACQSQGKGGTQPITLRSKISQEALLKLFYLKDRQGP